MSLYKHLVFAVLVAGFVAISSKATASDGYDFARVTEVIPIYTDVQVREPRTQCWEEQVAYRQPGSPAGAVIGGLIGAAIGNKAGGRGYHHRHHRRHHRGASTVAGAAVGALLGNEISRANAPTQYVTEQRCQVVDEFITRRELVGYDVRYHYNGRDYLTRTDQHPGDRIRVRVDVSPAW